ncbi:hypothetical protein RHMOL_Rhmol07G0064400 [Rhododendron molle]|uniref:Uncharacterized protein n=1 Tax=Rhododendron molle TaxID=49168 RepID=A0ACC0MXX9_RHOML|nr:hypothetical protein RHMOL_Rhmol07G0064400 [Rhododendron molle]
MGLGAPDDFELFFPFPAGETSCRLPESSETPAAGTDDRKQLTIAEKKIMIVLFRRGRRLGLLVFSTNFNWKCLLI